MACTHYPLPPPAIVTAVASGAHRDPSTIRRLYATGRAASTTRAGHGTRSVRPPAWRYAAIHASR